MMTDQEVLNYFAKGGANVCGRFNNDQLQRPLQPVKQERQKAWWVAAMMPMLMWFEKGSAQKKSNREDTSTIIKECVPVIMGKAIMPRISPVDTAPRQRTIYGTIMNNAGNPIPFASIAIDGKYQGVNADSTGAFTISFSVKSKEPQLEISAIGYEPQRLQISNINKYAVVLKTTENNLDNVTVTTWATIVDRLTLGTGAVVIVKDITVKDILRGIFFSPTFKIFPNPAQRGNDINIDVKKEGNYSIQLFDNTGKLISIKLFQAVKGVTQTYINIPPSLTAGMYYIRLVDDETKKQYSDKIMVM
jgi:hypothetical protein